MSDPATPIDGELTEADLRPQGHPEGDLPPDQLLSRRTVRRAGNIAKATARLADVLVTGRYEAAHPTTLIWRGSANQRMIPQTPLGRSRYADHLDHTPDHAPLQLASNGDRLVIIGTPRRGTLPRLERALRAQGLKPGDVTWRPSSEA